MKSVYIFIAVLLTLSLELKSQSCDINGKKHFTFSDVKTILDKNNCNSCHYKGSFQNTWIYDTYRDMTSRNPCNYPMIVHGKSNESLLIDKINGGPSICGNAMPPGSKMISDADLLALESWIDIGAPEHCIPEFEQVKEIFTVNKCNNCHKTNESWSFENYESLFLKPQNSLCSGPQLVKYNAEESLLYKKISDKEVCGDFMLVDGQPMISKDVDKVRDWINAGAPESARVLPVILTEFSTDILNNKKIQIYWKTESELNTSHFELQTSTDGIYFSFLAIVKSGETSGSAYHHLFDEAKIGFNYFRLKIVDFDNSYTYSPVRVERVSNDKEVFSISPVPMVNNKYFNVEWYPLDGREKARLLVMDILGNLCFDFILNNGMNNLNISGVKSGVYYFSIEDYNAARLVKKVIVLDN